MRFGSLLVTIFVTAVSLSGQAVAKVSFFDCGGLLTTSKMDPLMADFGFEASRIYLSTIGYSSVLSVTAYAPKDGVGRLLAFDDPWLGGDRDPMQSEGGLQHAARAFPKYFAKYDIKAKGSVLVIPDSTRLNSYLNNGLQFEDVSFLSSQGYKDSYFLKRLRRDRIVLLATRTNYMHHDRYQEHLLGGLMMPKVLVDQLFAYAEFEIALRKHKGYTGNRRIRSLVDDKGAAFSTSSIYDYITNKLGRAVDEISKNVSKGNNIGEEQVANLSSAILEASNFMDPAGKVEGLQSWTDDYFHIKDKKFAAAAQSLSSLNEIYLSNVISAEQARAEAEKLLAGLTN